MCMGYHNWLRSPSSTWGGWYLRSSLQGCAKTKLWVYFLLTVGLGTGGGILYKIIEQGQLLNREEFLTALCSSLPSLMGATLLDYLLDDPEPKTVLWIALLGGVMSFVLVICAYRFQSVPFVCVATVLTLLLAWAIKGKDKRFSCNHNAMDAVGGNAAKGVSGTTKGVLV